MAPHPTFEIAANQLPSQGSRALPLPFNFAAADFQEGDTYEEQENGRIDFIQSVFIDNSENPAAFTLTFFGMGQDGFPIIAKPNSQGFYPVTIPNGIARYSAQTDQADVDVLVILYNTPMAPNVWDIGAAAQNAVITGTTTNHSLTIAAGSTSEILIPANVNAKRRIIQNPSANADSIFIQFGGPATEDFNSQEILPGQTYDTAAGPIDTGAIAVISPGMMPVMAWEIA